MRTIVRNVFLLASIGLAVSYGARDARACGGTFCDGTPGPMQMSVDQTGENILFVSDGTSIEAHIQIQYNGNDAKRFAWVIPVQSDPTSIKVGSQQLFVNLLSGTVPTYGFSTVNDCPPPPPCFDGSGTGGSSSFGAGGGSGTAGGGGSGGGGPVVTFKATVGSFDVVVLKGGTADEVMMWLADNQFQQIPSAKAIIQDYLTTGHVFVAVKMTNGAGVDEIHPLVIKYVGQAPCVPLKLTAVAAVEDMGVRAFFLGGGGRWVPTNYKHMVLNEARIDWPSFAKNYDAVVSNAADAPVNDGHAFVTEYAGTSTVISQQGLYSAAWDPAPFPTLPVVQVVSTLTKQGLMSCQVGVSCTYNHPLVEGLLHEFLPPPAGVADAAFYGCLACYQSSIDLTKWDGAKFGQALIDRVIQPGARAQQILKDNGYATRLFTTISPSEMTVDPEFHVRNDLPQVTKTEQATRHQKCGATGFDLPDGREVALMGGSWPAWDASMPWVERVEEIPLAGPTIVLVDNKTAIDDAVAAWNTSQSWPPPPPPPPPQCTGGMGGKGGGTTGLGGSGAKGGGAGSTGTAGKGGTGTSAGTGGSTTTGTGGAPTTGTGGAPAAVGGGAAPGATQPAAEPSGGCSAALGRTNGMGAGILGLVAAALMRRRRR